MPVVSLPVLAAISSSWLICLFRMFEISEALVAIPEISWSPVFMPEMLFKLLMSVEVMLAAGLF